MLSEAPAGLALDGGQGAHIHPHASAPLVCTGPGKQPPGKLETRGRGSGPGWNSMFPALVSPPAQLNGHGCHDAGAAPTGSLCPAVRSIGIVPPQARVWGPGEGLGWVSRCRRLCLLGTQPALQAGRSGSEARLGPGKWAGGGSRPPTGASGHASLSSPPWLPVQPREHSVLLTTTSGASGPGQAPAPLRMRAASTCQPGATPPTPASSATASPKGPYTSRRPSSPSSASAFFHHRWVCIPDLRKGAVNKDTLLGPEASLVTT